MIAAALRARRIGTAQLGAALAAELPAIEALPMDPCVGYAAGAWRKGVVMERARGSADAVPTALGARVPALIALVRAVFRTDRAEVVHVFAAGPGAFVRPHRDWRGAAPIHTRVHLPLRTDAECLSSEDDVVYHMRAGEVWFVDASRPHAAGCFSAITRLHLVVDGEPEHSPEELVRDGLAASAEPPDVRELPPLRDEQLEAILALSSLVTPANLPLIADLLGTVHFGSRTSCAAMYDWLNEIARRSGERSLIARCAELERTYLVPFGSP